jgi:transglutaminase-like putative cysteine protease
VRLALRLGPVAVLTVYGALRWMAMLAPRATGRAWAATALALAAGALALAVGRLPARRRAAAMIVLGAAGFVAALLLAGVPARLLAPRRWDTLTAGIGAGLRTLPQVEVPYRGSAAGWTAQVIVLGGTLLPVAAALAACRPGARGRPPWTAALLLGLLVGVPAVVLPDAGLGHGALIFAALVALLALERARRRDAVAAGVALCAALGLALALFPAFDGPRPWFDYEAAADGLVPHPVTFDWSHSYRPLRWPRTGRELLRVHAAHPTYWKAENLDDFDGLRWMAAGVGATRVTSTRTELDERVATHPQDVQRFTVSFEALSSPFVIGAGDMLSVDESPRSIEPAPSTGTFVADPDLRQGDTYRVRAYIATPSPVQLRRAGTDFPEHLVADRLVALPTADADRPGAAGDAARSRATRGALVTITPPTWGSAGGPSLDGPMPDAVAGSAYAAVWRLAQRLKAHAATPYDYAQAIEAHLSRRFTYTETPPPELVPLADFLLRDHRGYCQHFSGAMALLLRMGGVPARVASGFSPGQHDAGAGDWVVRDVDAHSWVEAFFPGYGWVTFDPTPDASPARGQVTVNRAPQFTPGGLPNFGKLNHDLNDPRGTAAGAPLAPFAVQPASDGGFPVWRVVLGAVLAALAAAALALAIRRHRAGPPADAALAELERALRRTGRGFPARTTLRELEERLGHSAEAAAYVRAVRVRRYGGGGPGPTPGQRRGLRRELARGLGPGGVVRGWWALPPAARRPRA